MIGLRDAVVLSRTKLRTKRTRLVVTVIVSGLVFGLVIGALMIFSGVSSSLERYSSKQFDGKYFVSASKFYYPMGPEFDVGDPLNVSRSKELHKEFVLKRKAAAVKIGMPYRETDEESPVLRLSGEDYESVNLESQAGKLAQEESYGKKLKDASLHGLEYIKQQAAPYGAKDVFELKQLLPGGSSLMQNGTESFDRAADNLKEIPVDDWLAPETSTIGQLQYRLADISLLNSYLLPANDKREVAPAKNAIPVIVPLNVAAKTFEKSKKIPLKPKDAEKLTAWVSSVRSALNGETYSVCYRNAASQELVQKAVLQNKEITAEKDKPGYKPPAVRYTLPSAESCGPVAINDTRSASIKTDERKMLDFDELLTGPQQGPLQQRLEFVIVGLSPSQVDFTAQGLEAFVAGFVGMNLPEAAMIPRDMYEALPVEAQHVTIVDQAPATNQDKFDRELQRQFLVSFKDIESARAYMDEKGCSYYGTEAMDGCPKDKPLMLNAFGTNYRAIDEAVRYGKPVLLVALAIFGTVAGIIIMAMMGRVMADSRRETAVFRAIGARSSDIVKVYTLYAVSVAGRIAVFALLLGTAMALLLETMYATRASYYAQTAFGIFDSDIGFHFIGLNWYIFVIAAGIIGLGLVGVSLPLLRNIRRNPIRDMRDE